MGSVGVAAQHAPTANGRGYSAFALPPHTQPARTGLDTPLFAKQLLIVAALFFATSAGYAIRHLYGRDVRQPWQLLQTPCPAEVLAAQAAALSATAAAAPPDPSSPVPFNQTHLDALMKAVQLEETEMTKARAEAQKTAGRVQALEAQLLASQKIQAAAEEQRDAALKQRGTAIQQAQQHEATAAKLQMDAALAEAAAIIGDGGSGGRAQPTGNGTTQGMDVVGLALKPTCINKVAIEALQRFLSPRTIYVITATPRQCMVFRSWADNVQCYVQDTFLPGITKASVAEQLHKRYGVDASSILRGRDLSGWYLQQFIKLGAAAALPGLSQHFLLWDLDMIPLQPLQLLSPVPKQANASAAGGSLMQTLVQVGGIPLREYNAVYKTLFGQNLEFAPDGSSFVTHMMVVYKPFMQQFLAEVANTNTSSATQPEMWVRRILNSLPPKHLEMGFSEYASYISWVRQRWPGSQRLAPHRQWSRYGARGDAQAAKDAIASAAANSSDGLCCPQQSMLQEAAAKGLEYCGWDVGHVDRCHYSDPVFAEAYGVALI